MGGILQFLKRGRDASSAGRLTARRYLFGGHEYTMRYVQGARNGIRVNGGEFGLTLSEISEQNLENYLEGWYRRQCRAAFERAVDLWMPEFRARGYDFERPRLKIYKMRRAWGRCYYTKGVVTLNLHLIKCPPQCFEYIVLHELCHFVHHNHSRDFQALVGALCPDWKSRDAELKAFIRSRPTILQRLHI